MKQLKFWEPLPGMIRSGEKDTTWRIDDDRDLQAGDRISCITPDGEEFAQVDIVWTRMTTFAQLEEKDKEGHESFESEADMYEQYSTYYEMDVGPETEVKVVKFRLV